MQVLKKTGFYFNLLFFVVLFNSCTPEVKVYQPDLSDIPNQDIELVRFDKLLFDCPQDNLDTCFLDIRNKYPNFANIYFEYIFTWPLVPTRHA